MRLNLHRKVKAAAVAAAVLVIVQVGALVADLYPGPVASIIATVVPVVVAYLRASVPPDDLAEAEARNIEAGSESDSVA